MGSKNMRRRFTQIIISYAAFVMAMWLIFNFTVSAHNSKSLNETMDMAVNNILAQLDDEMNHISSVSTVMSGSSYIQEFLTEENVQGFYERAQSVTEIINNAAYPHMDADSIITITAQGDFFRFTGSVSRNGVEKLAAGSLAGMPLYSIAALDGTNYFCVNTPVYRHDSQSSKPIGYIVILTDVEKLRRTLAGFSTVSGIDAAIILDGAVLASGRPELDGQSMAALESQYGSVRSSQVTRTNLYAVAAITKDALHYGSRVFFLISAIVMAALLITIWLLYRVLSVAMVVPLLQKADHMKSGLLRTQINAHFIVNTIDCITKLIQQKEYGSAETAANNLTTLITDMHESGDETNIYHEMDFLTRYAEIVNIRSGGKYDIEMDVDDELGDYRMPPRVLQPLVENAIHHGFGLKAADCRLTVTGRLEKDCVLFEVADNGTGMEPGQVKGLQEVLDTADEWDYDEYRIKGVALLNIQKRIRGSYGKGYGLTVKGGPGRGFTVLVRLPLIEGKGDMAD